MMHYQMKLSQLLTQNDFEHTASLMQFDFSGMDHLTPGKIRAK